MTDSLSPEAFAQAELEYARVKVNIDDLIGHMAVMRANVPEASAPFMTDDSIVEWMLDLDQQHAILFILGLTSYIFDMTSAEQHALWADEHVCSDEEVTNG